MVLRWNGAVGTAMRCCHPNHPDYHAHFALFRKDIPVSMLGLVYGGASVSARARLCNGRLALTEVGGTSWLAGRMRRSRPIAYTPSVAGAPPSRAASRAASWAPS